MYVYKNKIQHHLPVRSIWTAWDTFFRQPLGHKRSVFSRPAARNVQHHCRGSEHHYTGKSLLLNMHCIRHLVQFPSNFIYLLCYPIYEAMKFHENVIGRPQHATPKGKCSEPRVAIVLCIQLMTLFSLAYAHNPQPPWYIRKIHLLRETLTHPCISKMR